ncbi:non-ribosomal peptide synthetase [Flavobacterium daejeonense]|uniref:non-ribosomal peptide synthetase n=1 Tax=Flavobacterium daejeonense TaxID=350893 RepID=UPI000478E9CF|nr:non-ribosomal peptide synthetase [Flavobacterium daejeonense]
MHSFKEEVLKSAQKYPDSIAIQDQSEEINYREFKKKIDLVSGFLIKNKIKKNDAVVVFGERSSDLIISIYSINFIGAIYVPISIQTPIERINNIINDCNPKIILADKIKNTEKLVPLNNKIKIVTTEIILRSKNDSLFQYPKLTNKEFSYIIYTSGTTGLPKGILIDNCSLVSKIKLLQKLYPLRKNDCFLFKTNIMFDVSLTEVFGFIFNGRTLVVLPESNEKDINYVIDHIRINKVTHVNFVPTIFSVFIETLEMNLNTKEKLTLKFVFLAGEELDVNLINKALELMPNTKFVNLYGPTESTIYVSANNIKSKVETKLVPIGRPLKGSKFYVIKDNMLQPIGIIGELYIGGEGLAVKYLNKIDLTNEFFIQNPLGIKERVYKTGDLVHWNNNGELTFIGRKDSQVKINGYRVELSEIEFALKQHPLVRKAIVIFNKEKNMIIAYYNSETEILRNELEQHLSKTLMKYSLPHYYILLKTIPVTNSGKIDKSMLPSPFIKPRKIINVPSSNLENMIRELWSEVLDIDAETIGNNDSFFLLGGDSIKATKFILKFKKLYEVDIPFLAIIEKETITNLADFIDKKDH